MSNRDTFRDRVRNGDVTIGTFLSMGSAVATEACALAGFDWLLVDLEHGAGGEDALRAQVLAARTHDTPLLVRAETAERIRIGRVLDLGADGVMLPRLDSAAEVRSAITHLRYPPEGDRGIASYNRARQFGLTTQSLADDNESIVGVVQIETPGAVQAAAEIAQAPHVDVLFVGPGDLSSALGVPDGYTTPTFLDALDKIVGAAHRAGVAAGILAGTPEVAQTYIRRGFTFVGVGSDAVLLARTSRIVIDLARRLPIGEPGR